LKQYLLENGILTEIHYPVSPNNQDGFKQIFEGQNFNISEKIHQTTISLPISYATTEDDVKTIIETINQFFE
jgi:dTDP-4-amino-4,6-dideoxygalactose transaminase